VAPVVVVAAGFTIKSGWASAVLLAGPAKAPAILDSRRVQLSDPEVPAAKQPYHAGFGTARQAGAERTRLLASVRRFGKRSVASVLRLHASGRAICGVGVVVGSLIDPAEIANDHIRIHALEGQLFRGIVIDTAQKLGLPFTIWRERDLYTAAATALKQSDAVLRRRIAALGEDVESGWRAEQKCAALAAWMVLARGGVWVGSGS